MWEGRELLGTIFVRWRRKLRIFLFLFLLIFVVVAYLFVIVVPAESFSFEVVLNMLLWMQCLFLTGGFI